jgi:S-adenosylmethionine hydrolase
MPPHDPPLIALLTDFGTRDPFVGVMKGVILGRCPEAGIVDLTHDIPPQGVVEAAFWLERSARWFPDGTVFVVVVDPGVGTARRGVALEARGHRFVGPDNGLFAAIAEAGAVCHAIDVKGCGLPTPSATFHGRDVFAPIAAEIASGRLLVSDVGPRVADLVPLTSPKPEETDDELRGVIVTIDRFGNLISNIDAERAASVADPVVVLAGRDVPVARTYSDVEIGRAVALVNAFGTVEVAVRDGNAAQALGVERGARVTVRPARRVVL